MSERRSSNPRVHFAPDDGRDDGQQGSEVSVFSSLVARSMELASDALRFGSVWMRGGTQSSQQTNASSARPSSSRMMSGSSGAAGSTSNVPSTNLDPSSDGVVRSTRAGLSSSGPPDTPRTRQPADRTRSTAATPTARTGAHDDRRSTAPLTQSTSQSGTKVPHTATSSQPHPTSGTFGSAAASSSKQITATQEETSGCDGQPLERTTVGEKTDIRKPSAGTATHNRSMRMRIKFPKSATLVFNGDSLTSVEFQNGWEIRSRHRHQGDSQAASKRAQEALWGDWTVT